MYEELICILQHSNLWKMKLVCIKLVEDIVWSEREVCIVTSDCCEGSEGRGLISRQMSKLQAGMQLPLRKWSLRLRTESEMR